MDPIREVVFDIQGTNPVNSFKGANAETVPLKDKTCDWIIPNGSPFFGEAAQLKVYGATGILLTRDRDYFVEGEFIPFVEVTGRSICSFIRLSSAILAANAFVKVDYQSIGAYFVPRNSLEEWLTAIRSGNKPVPWGNVFNKPTSYPSAFHLHSAKTEIGDWFELTWAFAYLAKSYGNRDPAVEGETTTAINNAFPKLRSTRDTQFGRIKTHDGTYGNTHKATKAHLLMGNHPNYGTATPEEDLAGLSSTLLSTPLGVQELVKTMTVDTDDIMRSGIFPISRFGGETFIPPSINGAFEGMGQFNEVTGICRESTGVLTQLANHTDGRSRGLYFTTADGYSTTSIKLAYSNYKYEPQTLKSIGVEPDRIIGGSGNEVIMVGDSATDNYYIAISNGTFDPSAHAYVKCDISLIKTDAVASSAADYSALNFRLATILHMGEFLVLFQTHTNSDGIGAYRVYRLRTADVEAGLPVAFERFNLTYQGWDGTQYSNTHVMVPYKTVRGTANIITRIGPFIPNEPVTRAGVPRKNLVLSAKKSGAEGIYYVHSCQFSQFFRTNGSETVTSNGIFEIIHELNVQTGVMTLTYKQPEVQFDSTVGNTFPTDMLQMQGQLIGTNFPGPVVLPSGEMVSGSVATGREFPTGIRILRLAGVTTPEEFVKRSWSLNAGGASRDGAVYPVVVPPTLNGTHASALSYEPDGEMFMAIDQTTNARRLYFRKVTGDYLIRDGIDNLTLGEVYSRPLSSDIYRTNLNIADSTSFITGSAAALATGGVDAGSASLAVMGWATTVGSVPLLNTLKAPVSGNVLYSCPRTYSKTLDGVTKLATYKADTFYGIRQAMVDKLKAYIPAADNTQPWSFTITHLGDEAGGMFKGLNISVITITWIVKATNLFRTQLVIGVPVIESPNADHPGVYLIQDFTVKDAPPSTRSYTSVARTPAPHFGLFYTYPARGHFAGYRDGNTLKVYMFSAFCFFTATGGTGPNCLTFDLNLTTLKVSGLFTGSRNINVGELAVMIPKVGLTDLVTSGTTPDNVNTSIAEPLQYDNTGGGATIFRKTTDGTVKYYLTSSVYPQTGWTIFIQDGIRCVLNGTTYQVTGGSLDLRDIDPSPGSKTFYIYVTVEDDEGRYIISTSLLRKSSGMVRVAVVKTNATQILTIDRLQPFMVGDFLLSTEREGGIIPVSSGFPQDMGEFKFLTRAELLP